MVSNLDGIAGLSLLPFRNSSAAISCTMVASCVGNRKCGVIYPVAGDENIEKNCFCTHKMQHEML